MDLPAEIPSAEASSELSAAFRDVSTGDGSSSVPPIHQPVAAVDVSSVEDEKLFVGQVSMFILIP